jgi:beta-barrel assembly-enhancing protease
MLQPNCRRGALVLLLAGLALALAGCDGGSLISHDQEIAMGRQAGDQFETQNGGLDADAKVTAQVAAIGRRIAEAAQPPQYPYEVRVLSSPKVNAVAFPGGRVYVFRGLVDRLNRNPDELAWVIAHEATHVAHRHAAKRIEQQLGYQAVISLIFNKGDSAQIAGAVANLMLLSYSRKEELDADHGGLIFTHGAGYDPTAAVAVLKTFQEIQGQEPSDIELMFDTHPGNSQRLKDVQAYLSAQGWHGQYYQY